MQAETMQNDSNNQWENCNCSMSFKNVVKTLNTLTVGYKGIRK